MEFHPCGRNSRNGNHVIRLRVIFYAEPQYVGNLLTKSAPLPNNLTSSTTTATENEISKLHLEDGEETYSFSSSSSTSNRESNSTSLQQSTSNSLVVEELPKSCPDFESMGACWCSYDEIISGTMKLRGNEPKKWIKYLEEGGQIFPLSLLIERKD